MMEQNRGCQTRCQPQPFSRPGQALPSLRLDPPREAREGEDGFHPGRIFETNREAESVLGRRSGLTDPASSTSPRPPAATGRPAARSVSPRELAAGSRTGSARTAGELTTATALATPSTATATATAGFAALAGDRRRQRAVVQIVGVFDRQLRADEPFDRPQLRTLLRRAERNRLTRRPRPAGPADAVNVGLRLDRHVEIDDVRHVVNVNSPGRHVGRHQHVEGPLSEPLQRPLAGRLGFVAVDRGGANPAGFEFLRQLVGPAFGAGEK